MLSTLTLFILIYCLLYSYFTRNILPFLPSTDGDYYDYLQFESDFALLSQLGIRMYILPRLKPEKKKVSFGEMALLKTTPWNFTNYDRIQYLDGDVLPTQNLDCYFQLDQNAFNTGNASPLNSGWYMAIPSISLYNKMRQLAILRLSTPWDEEKGWGTVIPKGQVTFRNNGKAVAKWDFNGASLDQGATPPPPPILLSPPSIKPCTNSLPFPSFPSPSFSFSPFSFLSSHYYHCHCHYDDVDHDGWHALMGW